LTAKPRRELDHRDALIAHLREHSLRTDGPFTLRSGATSDWYLDARQTTFDGTGGVLVGEAVLEDTATTGSALVEAIAAVRGAGAEVVQALSLVDRSGPTKTDGRLAAAGRYGRRREEGFRLGRYR
jgi:orotate phosphoribosyltransferase